MRQCRIDLNVLQPFEAGSVLLGLLCYPSASELDRWKNTASALAARFVQEQRKSFPANLGWQIASRRPEYSIRNNRTSIDGIRKRSAKAMEVGGITLTYLKESLTCEPPIMPDCVASHSLMQMTNAVRSEQMQRVEPDAVYKDLLRTWHRWMPVAHLAAAYRAFANQLGVTELAFPADNIELHKSAVALANEFAGVLQNMPGLPWLESDPVQLTWVEERTDFCP